ncbi:MAG: hypothetical protein J0I23_15545 [Rhizobiales bacterium]|nr:hypothetical protein [Hyphomicrobiales bacterium]
MDRYFFDLSNGFGDMKDSDGQQLPSLHDVEKEVGRILADVIRDSLGSERHGHIGVSARDESGRIVCTGNVLFSLRSGQAGKAE